VLIGAIVTASGSARDERRPLRDRDFLPAADVAISLLRDTGNLWAVGVVMVDDFVDTSEHEPYVGEDVFFA
jgi:hypothetical protein